MPKHLMATVQTELGNSSNDQCLHGDPRLLANERILKSLFKSRGPMTGQSLDNSIDWGMQCNGMIVQLLKY